MTTRNLTSQFEQFRNRATREPHYLVDNKSIGDRTALLQSEDEDIVHFEKPDLPLWMELERKIQLQLDEVRSQVKKLQQLQNKYLKQPDFDDNLTNKKQIDTLTNDITTMLQECNASVQRLSLQAKKSQKNSYDQRLISNAVQAAVTAFQDITTKFRNYQWGYILQLKHRNENSRQTMTNFDINMHSNPFTDQDDPDIDFDQLTLTLESQDQVTSLTLKFEKEREKEIRETLQSMNDVNNIFNDIATLVSSQGTYIDQIEYNIEETVVQLEQGNQHLVKAVEHQNRLLKWKLIFIGIGVAVLLFIILMSII
ncbi:unnamed protein product [Adineta steineri]|uniref:t-SNARE coiled-coil homology domain-containing protein n=1 Tax=Adineta steineri TaxID=433720 RepID=A0A815QG22_9BILA|nr:unnamed protein product [Adineta steineri]CAF3579895.1 unnamed protein product [Adineta steineri]